MKNIYFQILSTQMLLLWVLVLLTWTLRILRKMVLKMKPASLDNITAVDCRVCEINNTEEELARFNWYNEKLYFIAQYRI
jgi:hypothetical protein